LYWDSTYYYGLFFSVGVHYPSGGMRKKCGQTPGHRSARLVRHIVQKTDGINEQKADDKTGMIADCMVQKAEGIYNGQKADDMVQIR
jgi:hypothetical protein